jgi:tetratricopeptide (TPR) repeat protein
MRRPFSVLIICLISGLSAAVTHGQIRSATEPIEIRGQVRYALGGAPVENITIHLEKLSGGFVGEEVTDRNGRFKFAGLLPIQYLLYVRQPGYQEIQREVNLVMTSAEYLQLQLLPNDPEKATASPYASKLIDANVPSEARREFERGQSALFEKKKPDEAIPHFEKAIQLYPRFVEANLSLGTAYMDEQKWDAAETPLKRAFELEPKAANALFALGEIYLQQRRYDQAETTLRQGLNIENRSWQGHFTLGRVYWNRNSRDDLAKAGRQIALTLQLNPSFAEAHLLGANILLRARKTEDALAEFEEYLRLDPKGRYATQARATVQKIKGAQPRK